MTTQGPGDPRGSEPGALPEGLALRGRQAPVTRINRKVLIGGAAVLLLLISLVVLAALRPPSLRIGGSQELYNVEHKPITEALTKLPATYDGVPPAPPAGPVVAHHDPGVPHLKVGWGNRETAPGGPAARGRRGPRRPGPPGGPRRAGALGAARRRRAAVAAVLPSPAQGPAA